MLFYTDTDTYVHEYTQYKIPDNVFHATEAI